MSSRFFVLFFHVFTRLKHLDDMLSSACLSAEAVYKVLYWDDHVKSSRFVSSLIDCVSYQCLRARWHLQYFSAGSLEGCYYWFACYMLLLWAGCLLDSTALSSCGTETSAEVRTSPLEEALPNSLELLRKICTTNEWVYFTSTFSFNGPSKNVPRGSVSSFRGSMWRTGANQLVGQYPHTNKSGGERSKYSIMLIAEAFIHGSRGRKKNGRLSPVKWRLRCNQTHQ